MMKRLPFAFLLLLAACGSTSSAGIATSDFDTYYAVHVVDDAADPARSSIRYAAIFSKNLTTDIRLEDGDSVTVTTDRETDLPLTLGDLNVYSVQPPAGEDRLRATFDLRRPNATSAPASTVALPPRLAITTPAMPTVAYAGGTGTFKLEWSNAVPEAKVQVHIDPCDGVSTVSGDSLPDTGSVEIPTRSLSVAAPTAATCIVLTIFRRLEGTPDPALKVGSDIYADRSGKFKLTLTPDAT